MTARPSVFQNMRECRRRRATMWAANDSDAFAKVVARRARWASGRGNRLPIMELY